MGTPAVSGALGWYPQVSKADYPAPAQAYHWHKVHRATFATAQIQRVFDPETGSSLLPGGAYKGGVWAAGQFALTPRLNDALCWLMFNFAGQVTSTGSGPYTHFFGGADTTAPNKFMAFRRMIPKQDASFFGETFYSGKVVSIAMGVTPGTVAGMNFGVQALVPVPNESPSGTGWAPTTDQGGYDDYSECPVGCKGVFELPDGTPFSEMRNVTVNAVLQTPPPEQQMVLGSYYPTDVTGLARSITIRGQCFWNNPDLYTDMYYGGGTTWTPAIWTGGQPLDLWFETPGTPFGGASGILGFKATTVIWEMQPIDIVPGDFVLMDVAATVIDTGSGTDWWFYVRNNTASYTWPT
jgi:hypothetical protein